MIDYRRASEAECHLFSNIKLLQTKTSLIAEDNTNLIATLQYQIINFNDAEITLFKSCKSEGYIEVLTGFIDEMMYWNPYLKQIDISILTKEELIDFKSSSSYNFNGNQMMTNSNINVIKVLLKDIIPEQLTVDENKLLDVRKWILKPEDIVVSCVEIEDDYVCIDGHSRLVEAYLRGYEFVYIHLDKVSDIELYKECLKWCREDGLYTIEDLSFRVVSKEEHQRLWINRCQAYLGN